MVEEGDGRWDKLGNEVIRDGIAGDVESRRIIFSTRRPSKALGPAARVAPVPSADDGQPAPVASELAPSLGGRALECSAPGWWWAGHALWCSLLGSWAQRTCRHARVGRIRLRRGTNGLLVVFYSILTNIQSSSIFLIFLYNAFPSFALN